MKTNIQIVIDARTPGATLRMFDIPVFERILRQLFVCNVRGNVFILTNPDKPALSNVLRKDFKKYFQIDFQECRPDRILMPGKVLILSGHGVYDDRILEHLLAATDDLRFCDTNSSNDVIAATLQIQTSQSIAMVHAMAVRLAPTSLKQIPAYIRFLRKNIVPKMQPVSNPTGIKDLEKVLFKDTFKGGLELIAVYGYQPVVRELTRWTSRTFLTPNMITGAAFVMRFGAMPLMATGWLASGLIVAALFIILDSLDGKLARMTYRFSDTFDKIDHWGSLPARVGWYACIAWGLTDGQWNSRITTAGFALVILTLLDDLNWLWAKRFFRKTLYDLSVMDERLHLFNVRRNDIFFLLIGLIFGYLEEFFLFLPIWSAFIFLWHTGRLAWMTFNGRRLDTPLSQSN